MTAQEIDMLVDRITTNLRPFAEDAARRHAETVINLITDIGSLHQRVQESVAKVIDTEVTNRLSVYVRLKS